MLGRVVAGLVFAAAVILVTVLAGTLLCARQTGPTGGACLLLEAFNLWQSLASGVLAVAGAAATVYALRLQMDADRARHDMDFRYRRMDEVRRYRGSLRTLSSYLSPLVSNPLKREQPDNPGCASSDAARRLQRVKRQDEKQGEGLLAPKDERLQAAIQGAPEPFSTEVLELCQHIRDVARTAERSVRDSDQAGLVRSWECLKMVEEFLARVAHEEFILGREMEHHQAQIRDLGPAKTWEFLG